MDELLEFENSVINGIDWLESAQAFLSEQKEETEGKWQGVVDALTKLDAAMLLLREVCTPLQGEIASAWQERDRMAE